MSNVVGGHSLILTPANGRSENELTKIIKDFDRAMNFEALRMANETSSMLSFSEFVDG